MAVHAPHVSAAGKKTFREMRRAYNAGTGKELTSMDIAEEANVFLADEWTVEIGGVVPESVAHNVIDAFANITGERIELADLVMHIKPEKPNLKLLLQRHKKVTMVHIARTTGLPIAAVWAMVCDLPVYQDTAMKILSAFNLLAGTAYSLDGLCICFAD